MNLKLKNQKGPKTETPEISEIKSLKINVRPVEVIKILKKETLPNQY